VSTVYQSGLSLFDMNDFTLLDIRAAIAFLMATKKAEDSRRVG
jgi:hypothetical protein